MYNIETLIVKMANNAEGQKELNIVVEANESIADQSVPEFEQDMETGNSVIEKKDSVEKVDNNVEERILPDERRGKVKDWGEMSYYLPKDLSDRDQGLLRGYFRAQILIVKGRRIRASRLLRGLDKLAGFTEFEDDNEELLKKVDIAVRGETYRGKPTPNI